MQTLTSVQNPLVKAARALQTREGRMQSGLFLCDGEHMVAEALQGDASAVQTVFVAEDRRDAYAALLAKPDRAEVFCVSTHVLEAISQVRTPQGIAATVRLPAPANPATPGARVVLLEAVQDPGNVGTILRTMDAAGFDACLLGPGCADPFSPKALRATMGAVFRVPVASVPDAAQAAAALAAQGYAVLASVLDGEDFYRRTPLPPQVCLLVGNEGAGLTAATAAAATHRYRLPMRGGAESLNAAVAAAIFLYEIQCRG